MIDHVMGVATSGRISPVFTLLQIDRRYGTRG